MNFEYWISYQLCRFRCKSATAYVLHNFSNVLADWYFSWIYLTFHWLSPCGVFPGVLSLWPKKKRHREKNLQKMFLQTQSKMSVHIVFQGKIQLLEPQKLLQKIECSYKLMSLADFSLGTSSGRKFFKFDTWLSFLLWWYFFESLGKTFGKKTIYFKKISHRLLCVPFFILTLQGLGRGVQRTPLVIKLTLL